MATTVQEAKGASAKDTGTVEKLLTLVQQAVGLDSHQAKLVVYYALATHGLAKLERFPILVLYGPHGTGKTTLLSILRNLVYEPRWLDGKDSYAVVRDALEQNTTALIDEADDVSKGKKEQLFVNRYSRQSETVAVNRGSGMTGYAKAVQALFGAAVLHRRIPFKDPAIQSRAVLVKTKKLAGKFNTDLSLFEPSQKQLEDVATRVDWGRVGELGGNRTRDTWAPLLAVAEFLHDDAWLTYAEAQVVQAEAESDSGREAEPTIATFCALLAAALDDGNGGHLLTPKPRVEIAAVKVAVNEEGQVLNSHQVGVILRGVGFETGTQGGKQYVFTGGADKLREVGRELEIQDEWLEQAGHESGA